MAQEKMEYRNKEKTVKFQISEGEYYLKFSNENRQILVNNVHGFTDLAENQAVISLGFDKNYLKTKMKFFKEHADKILEIKPVLIYEDGTKQICTREIIVKTKENAVFPTQQLSKFSFTIQPDNFSSNQFIVQFDNITTEEIFQLVDNLNANRNIEFAEPNFIRLLKLNTNDPFFDNQWSLNNQGYLGGVIDADMDVVEAWQYSTGQNVKVAVLDEGVDLTHPDLASNLLPGYDATGNNSLGAPNKTNNDAHGTACAGIIAGVGNNNIGVAGVAYDSKIIPIRIGYSNGNPLGDPYRFWITQDNWIMDGFNWAVQNGTDIISNSWTGGSESSGITNAILNAVNNGRNGKGCVVLFSSGNNNGNISYPATLSSVITVGATSQCDERKSFTSCDGESWGSNYGAFLDVVAPGVKIFTTDISGINGYNSSDYISDFGGTSSACPNAAGVAALVLSVNPNISQLKVREILESSTDKISGYSFSNYNDYPNGTWNNQVGYGRLNAFNAVYKAKYGELEIIGPETICYDDEEIYLLSNFIDNNETNDDIGIYPNIQWTTSSNLRLLSFTATSATVTIKNSSDNGYGYIQATKTPLSVKKNVWLGKPFIDIDSYWDEPARRIFMSLEGKNGIDINDQTITNVSWEVIAASGGGRLSGSCADLNCTALGPWNSSNWFVDLKIKVSNSCGEKVIYFTAAPPPPFSLLGDSHFFELVSNPNNIYTINNIKDGISKPIENFEIQQPNFKISVYDFTGNKVMETPESKVDISYLKSGIYILKAIIHKDILTKKVIK